MWLLDFIPSWTFAALLVLGLAAFAVSSVLKTLPYVQYVRYSSIAVVVVALYLCGAAANHKAWKDKASALEKQVLELQAKSSDANTKIVTKVLTKQQIVREKSDEIIKYVDREIIKYDQSCILPKEVVQAHNKAAKQ